MDRFKVTNPTSRKKAVRVPGSLQVVGIGETKEVDAVWDAPYIAHLRSTGLKVDGGPAASEEEPKGKEPTERQRAIMAAIETLNSEDLDNNGKPKLDAINKAMASDAERVSGKERDEVWALRK